MQGSICLKLAFFVDRLPAGKHVLHYRLRAETPGAFRVLPSSCFAMYAPEIRANGADEAVQIGDQ